MINQLNGLGSIRFYYGDLADWNASGKILSVNEIAIVTDVPGSYKQGQALPSIGSSNNPKTGPTFAQLPWFTPSGAANQEPIIYSTTTGITAHAGGGQANAVQLTTEFNEVTVVATSGDSVKLPSAVAGLAITIKNNGSEALAVFPFLGDSINTGVVNASVSLSPGVAKTFRAQDITVWQETAGPVSVNRIPAAINASATATAAQIGTGAISSTSAAAVALVLPTTALLVAYLGAAFGTEFSFWIDNVGGANTVTLTVGTGMVAATAITGENTLTVAAGMAAKFTLYFYSGTSSILGRVV